MNKREKRGKGISILIILLFVMSAFSPLLISASASASDSTAKARGSDADGLRDDVEEMSGIDPYNRDTDYDGLTDYYESTLTYADPGTEINPCSDEAQAIVDNVTIYGRNTHP